MQLGGQQLNVARLAQPWVGAHEERNGSRLAPRRERFQADGEPCDLLRSADPLPPAGLAVWAHVVARVGVAAHEAGHALQDQHNYAPLQLRTNIVPAVQVGGWVGPLMLMAGLFISPVLAWVGVLLFGLTVIFSLVTLPVEFDASKRARQLLSTEGIIVGNEMDGINKVLNAAALTYVAAAIQAIGQLAYYVFMLMGNSDD